MAIYLFLWLLTAPAVLAGVYTWKDDKGKIHFTDALHKIPERFRNEEQGFKKLQNARPPSSLPVPSREVPEQTSYSPQAANGREYVIPLIPTAGGNFMVDTTLNGGVKARLMVDTGASLVTISEQLAKKIGFRKSYGSAEIPFSTAGGVVWMPMIALDQLTIGEASLGHVVASVNDQMGDLDGLLGMSFLGDFRVEMDKARSQMILRPLGAPGAQTWNGKSALWWKSRFTEYTQKVREFQAEAKNLAEMGHPKAANVKKMVGFYKDLHRKLDLQASSAGVPNHLRSFP